MSLSVLPLFSSKSFMVCGLTFRPLIHFEFIFVYGVRKLKQGLCINLVVWGGEGDGREVQEGEDIRIPMANSC